MKYIKNILRKCITLCKISLFFLFVLFLPHLFNAPAPSGAQQSDANTNTLTLGIENMSDDLLKTMIADKSYTAAILTNHTGKDQQGNRNIDILLKKGIRLTTIFVPQHGYYADRASPCPDGNCFDSITKLPMISWY